MTPIEKLLEKLQEAVKRAEQLSTADDRLITIELRGIGIYVYGQREIDGMMRRCCIHLPWAQLESCVANPALVLVETINARLAQE